MKYSPLIAAIIGAIALIVQQALQSGQTSLKVVGFAALIAAIGAASVWLKGKGATLAGIIGTVGFTFYTVWESGNFTWNEFILTSVLAVISLFAPSLIPEKEQV